MGITPGIPRPGGGGLGDIPANTALGNFTEASAVPTPQTKSVWLTWLNAATVDDLNSLGSVVSSIGSSLTALSETVATKVPEGDPRLTNARDWFASSVSQAEAEAGTEVVDRKWSALRVRQSTRVNPDWDPTGNLFTIGTSTNAQRLRLRRRFAGAGDFSQLSIDFSGDNCRILTQHAGNNPNPLILGTGGVERFFIHQSNNWVGIGGAPTTRPLEIFAGTAGFRLQSSSAVSPPVYTEIARTFDFQTWQDSTSPFNTSTDLVANSNQFNNHSIRLFVHTSGVSAPVLHSVFHASGRLSVGTDVDNGTDRVQVNGTGRFTGGLLSNSLIPDSGQRVSIGTGTGFWLDFDNNGLYARNANRPLGTVSNPWGTVTCGAINSSGATDVLIPSSPSTRETIFRARISDSGNDAFHIFNATIGDGGFAAGFSGSRFTASAAALVFAGNIDSANDTGSNAIVEFVARRTSSTTDPNNGTLSDVVTRPLFAWRSQSTIFAQMFANGNLALNSTTDSGAKLQVNVPSVGGMLNIIAGQVGGIESFVVRRGASGDMQFIVSEAVDNDNGNYFINRQGETFARAVFARGFLGFGPGTATRDTFIRRVSAGVWGLGTAFDNSLGSLQLANITASGTSTFNGLARFTGGVNESQQNLSRIDIGVQATPRMIFEDATSSTIWAIDNQSGTFRWFTPGVVRMSLNSSGSLTLPTGTITTTQLIVGGSGSASQPLIFLNGAGTGNAIGLYRSGFDCIVASQGVPVLRASYSAGIITVRDNHFGVTSAQFDAATVGADTRWSRSSAGVWRAGTTANNALGSVELFNLTAGGNITATGHITSAFQSLSADPSTIDIPSGSNRIVKNTTSGEVRDWVNDGGVMKKSPAYT